MAYARPLIDAKDVQAILQKDSLDTDDKKLPP